MLDFPKDITNYQERLEFIETPQYKQMKSDYFAFLEKFFTALYKNLDENEWTDIYTQRLINEPRTLEDYAELSQLCRRTMPGIRIANELHSWGIPDKQGISRHVDLWVMPFHVLDDLQEIIQKRNEKGLESGLYTMAVPGPPWPNRHLDRFLSDNRLIPWLVYYYGIDMYDHWAPNRYRGADPYASSVGPMPSGAQLPGHPPGDNWLYYPDDNGIIPSLRVITFRDGLDDYILLKQTAEISKEKSQMILKSIAESGTEYTKNPENYYTARRQLLEFLENKE
jgi:hypothetical protein